MASDSNASRRPPERDGFQPAGMAWSPDRDDIERLLSESQHREVRSIYYGSNGCYLLKLDGGPSGCSFAVYKPARGEYPLWDFPQGTLYRREVAAYLVDRLIGWNLVPPTVVGKGRYGVGSIQLFIEEAAEQSVSVAQLRRLALLDCVLNNADRKADHLLVDASGRLWGIDHGLSFHIHPKLRTVLWHFAGQRFPRAERTDLERLRTALDGHEAEPVDSLLSSQESVALRGRVDRLLRTGVFPDPRHKAVPYRW